VGRGTLNDAAFSPDGQFIFAAYSSGVSIFRAQDLSESAFLPVLDDAQVLGLFADGQQVAIGTLTGQVLFARFDPASGSLTLLPQTLDARPLVPAYDEYPNRVFALSISPDGEIAGVVTGQQAQFWNLTSGQTILSEPFTGNSVKVIQFSANSRYAWVTFGRGAPGFVIDLQTGSEALKVDGYAVGQFLGEDQFVTAQVDRASQSYSLIVLSLADGKAVRMFNLDGTPNVLLFSPDGKTLAAVFKNLAGAGFNAPQSTALVSFRPNYPTLADVTATNFEFIAILTDTSSGEISNKRSAYLSIPFTDRLLGSPDSFYFSGDWLLASDWAGGEAGESSDMEEPYCVIRATDLVSNVTNLPFPKERTLIGQLSCRIIISADQQQFAFFNPSGLVLLKAGAQQALMRIDNHPSPVTALEFSTDGGMLAVGRADTAVQFFKVTDGLNLLYEQTLEKNLCGVSRNDFLRPSPSSGITGIAYDGAANRFGMASVSGNLYWLSASGDSPAPPVTIQKGECLPALYGLEIAPDGNTLAVGGYINAVRLRQGFEEGLVGVKFLEDSSEVSTIDYAPNGELLAAGANKGVIRFWNPVTLTLERSLWGHSQWVSGLAFDAAGQKLYSVSEDGTARVWQVSDGTETQVLELNAPATSMALDPQGLWWAIGTRTGTVYFWNVQTGQWAGHLHVGAQPIWALVFSPDGAQLALGMQSGQLELWQMRDANGTVAAFAEGGPLKPSKTIEVCSLRPEEKAAAQQGGVFVAGTSPKLDWDFHYDGDCSALDEKSLSKLTDLPEIITTFTLTYYPSDSRLHITAEITLPSAGSYEYAWQLRTPEKTTTLTANFTVVNPSSALKLPAPLYFIAEDGALLRLEKDGFTQTPVIEAPVQCMDVSSTGEIAYLTQDSLSLTDADGGNKRLLLPIAGCPSWSPDGSQIGFILNGVKVLDVELGTTKTLDTNLNVYGTNVRHYHEIADWSPLNDRLIASVGGWEWYSHTGFEVDSGNEFDVYYGDTGSWSRDGQYIYGAQAEYSGYDGTTAGIVRTHISSGEQDILMGNGGEDSNGGFGPFETLEGRLLVFASQDTREANPCSEGEDSFTLYPARMSSGTLGKFSYDENISFPSSLFRNVLWWDDGRAAILGTGCEGTSSNTYQLVRPFEKAGSAVMPIRGTNLRWGR
jgi:WD40 repeat protein